MTVLAFEGWSQSELASGVAVEIGSSQTLEPEIRYSANRRLVSRWEYLPAASAGGPLSLRDQGVYIITGGAGGLGLLLAEHMAAKSDVTLILVGRSELSEKNRQSVASLRGNGAKIIYRQVDVRLEKAVRALV